MSVTAQRIRSRATEIRRERAARAEARGPVTKPYDAERDESPDDESTLAQSPIEDAQDRIARTEGLSTFRSSDDMRGLGDPGVPGGGLGAEIERLGSELAEQVDGRVSSWLDEFREEMGGTPKQGSQSFMVGAVFGGVVLALGVLLGGRTRFR